MKDIAIDGLLVIGLITFLFILVLELSILFDWNILTMYFIDSFILSGVISSVAVTILPFNTGPR